MLNMLRINIENTIHAKALIEFFLLHRDVARVLICTPQYTDNGEILHMQRVKCTITTKRHNRFRIKLYFCENVNVWYIP